MASYMETSSHQIFGEWVVFKLTDYANVPTAPQRSSHSTIMRQLMMPGYMVPELLSTGAFNLSLLTYMHLPYLLMS